MAEPSLLAMPGMLNILWLVVEVEVVLVLDQRVAGLVDLELPQDLLLLPKLTP